VNLRFLTDKAFDDFVTWAETDPRIFAKVIALIKDIKRTPFKGMGKPEPLKHALSGYWSRRITDEHRLVYKIIDGDLGVASCRYHYSKSAK
jgi:toxin YoeB